MMKSIDKTWFCDFGLLSQYDYELVNKQHGEQNLSKIVMKPSEYDNLKSIKFYVYLLQKNCPIEIIRMLAVEGYNYNRSIYLFLQQSNSLKNGLATYSIRICSLTFRRQPSNIIRVVNIYYFQP